MTDKYTDDPYYVSPEEEAENEREYPAGPVTEEDVMDAPCAKDRDPKGGDPYPGLRGEAIEPDPKGRAQKESGNRQSGSGT